MIPFDTILVANRGEIACRVIRTARARGFETVAVWSDADREAPHVRLADRSVGIGPAEATSSYLDIERLLDAARRAGAGAVHPGYGFLSENADFAQACADAGLVFIGPLPGAIRAMGDKAGARRLAEAAGVPCVPGYDGEDQSDNAMAVAAEEIGFPLMIKAAAGGGGKGMRLVTCKGDLAEALTGARTEARTAFGSDRLMLEKAIPHPRHVEVQITADAHGAVLHLGDRDCSVQRRHQKVIEEAPAPCLGEDLKVRMAEAAVAVARSVAYRGAGTVEFLLDRDGAFYFLEMNTRLQVEHPVTEMITGIDLVAWQIDIARGLALPLDQDGVDFAGHAIEARLYAEDPHADFLPQSGRVALWHPPGDGVRIDAGVEERSNIEPFYDPLIAKIIAHGATRDEARRRLLGALRDTALLGVPTNKHFLIEALADETFVEGAATTGFIAERFPGSRRAPPPEDAETVAIAAALLFCARLPAGGAHPLSRPHHLRLEADSEPVDVAIAAVDGTGLVVVVGPERIEFESFTFADDRWALTRDGMSHRGFAVLEGRGRVLIDTGRTVYRVEDTLSRPPASLATGGAGTVAAPMHGRITAILVVAGDRVSAGDRLMRLEAMKMEHVVAAPAGGVVREIAVAAGDQVSAGQVLLEIDAEETDA